MGIQQKDYILKEIEKIGTILNAIRLKLFGGYDNLSLTLENQIDFMREMMREVGFDFDKFMNLDKNQTSDYLKKFLGFNIDNIDKFADNLYIIGLNNSDKVDKKYLIKALELFEIVNIESKTYSFERENKILEIKNNI